MHVTSPPAVGQEWIIEAFGCDPAALSDAARLAALFDLMIDELALNPVAEPVWHVFPPPSGITGICLLAESHLTCHTFPEHGSLCLNLFCCTARPEWDYRSRLAELFGADRVEIRRIPRPYAASS